MNQKIEIKRKRYRKENKECRDTKTEERGSEREMEERVEGAAGKEDGMKEL